jgi:hypothetical protein
MVLSSIELVSYGDSEMYIISFSLEKRKEIIAISTRRYAMFCLCGWLCCINEGRGRGC